MPTLAQHLANLASRIAAEFNALRGELAAAGGSAPVALTRASFDLLAGEGELVPERFYIISDQDSVFIALSSTAYLVASTAKIYPPLNLLENGLLEDGGPPPVITPGGGTATLVVDQTVQKLRFTGGTAGGLCSASWTIAGLTAGKYTVKFEVSDQALSCRPTFNLGGYITSSFSLPPGEHVIELQTLATDESFAVTFSPNSAGRTVAIGKLRLYRKTVPLTLSNAAVTESAPVGTIVGVVERALPGATLTLAGDAEGRVALDGLNVVTAQPLDYEQWTNHIFQITELSPGAEGSPRTTNLGIGVTNVTNLQQLAVTPQTIYPGINAYTWEGQLINMTPGSTLELVDGLDGRFVLDGSILKNAIVIPDQDGAVLFPIVRETLFGAEDSPKDSLVQIVVADEF